MHEVHPDMSPYHVRIYEAIREHWWYKGSAPSKAELSRACRCSSTTVQQAFTELRRRGLIVSPKFSVRSARPTDMSRTISVAPPDPWADLADDDGPKFWKLDDA